MSIEQLTYKSRRLVVGAIRKIVFHPKEALLLCRMALWVGVLSMATRLYPLPRALAMVAADNSNSQPSNHSDIQQRLARAIDLLLSIDLLIFKPICWKRAAILHRYLSLNGIASRIVFGVRTEDGKVNGHAWLENDAGPILESDPPNYVVTYSFPSNSPCKTELALLSGK
ncbi:MAG TPA: lasso peptide biosynthesis B2 protein [Pyrinomonadaceae bacterium]